MVFYFASSLFEKKKLFRKNFKGFPRMKKGFSHSIKGTEVLDFTLGEKNVLLLIFGKNFKVTLSLTLKFRNI